MHVRFMSPRMHLQSEPMNGARSARDSSLPFTGTMTLLLSIAYDIHSVLESSYPCAVILTIISSIATRDNRLNETIVT